MKRKIHELVAKNNLFNIQNYVWIIVGFPKEDGQCTF